jgi:predicted phosphodiesterase
LTLCGRKVLLTHAGFSPESYDYIPSTSPRFRQFGDLEDEVVLYGHTHEAIVRVVGKNLIVNPGAAGRGRLEAGLLKYSCAVVDLDRMDAEIIEYTAD